MPFFVTASLYRNINHKKIPKLLSGRDQFTEGEVPAFGRPGNMQVEIHLRGGFLKGDKTERIVWCHPR